MVSVLHDWVSELPLMQQTVLIAAIRGCDGLSKHDISKKIVREYRKVVLKDAKPPKSAEHSFMTKDVLSMQDIRDMCQDFDKYPVHFLMHLIHAIEIVAYKHPDPAINVIWTNIYFTFVHALHLNPETITQLDQRLNA